MPTKLSIFGIVIIAITGCSAGKPTYVSYDRHPLLNDESGVVVIVDVCIRRKELIDNYIIVEESKAVAQSLLSSIRKYLETHNVKVREMIAPTVCGFLSVDKTVSQSVADRIDAEIRQKPSPFGVDNRFSTEPTVVEAFTKVGINAYLKPWVDAENRKNKTKNADYTPINLPISKEDFSSASLKISKKLQTNNALYVSIAGISGSGGLGAANFLSNVAVATVTAGAIGPTNITPNIAYFVGVAPFPTSSDSWRISASLMNLVGGQIQWSYGLGRGGDPIEPKTINSHKMINDLLGDLVLKDATVWTPPGYNLNP